MQMTRYWTHPYVSFPGVMQHDVLLKEIRVRLERGQGGLARLTERERERERESERVRERARERKRGG